MKAKITDRYNNIANHTDGVIFLGTPHRGSNFATHGRLLAKILCVLGSSPLVLEGLHDRAYGLKDLHSEFISTYARHLDVVNFFEERKTCFFRFGFVR